MVPRATWRDGAAQAATEPPSTFLGSFGDNQQPEAHRASPTCVSFAWQLSVCLSVCLSVWSSDLTRISPEFHMYSGGTDHHGAGSASINSPHETD